ncbi:MAG: hypothetical protein JWQ42_4599 [Edaphobacter sp.]|nr:hypothetical protein [Edaphobacter sp.]
MTELRNPTQTALLHERVKQFHIVSVRANSLVTTLSARLPVGKKRLKIHSFLSLSCPALGFWLVG